MECLNIGYQGKSFSDFCDSLVANGVETLVDVRANAWSQRPEFRKSALQAALASLGIDYVHCKIAGNPYRSTKLQEIETAPWVALFSAHLERNPQIIEALEQLVFKRISALLCYEARRQECHRGILIGGLLHRWNDLRIVDL